MPAPVVPQNPDVVYGQHALTPREMHTALTLLLTAKQPVCIWGPFGIGKSQVIQQTAATLGMPCIDVRLVLLDPTDLRGLPTVTPDGRVRWATPEFLPRDGNGILFMDEYNRAPVSTQNAGMQLLLDRKLGEYKLPDGWAMALACNRETDGGGVTKMPEALSNRLTHLNLKTDLNDWCAWAAHMKIEPVVIAFMRFRPNLLHVFSTTDRACPTPRTWEFVSRIVAQKPAKDVERALIAGTVGHEAATEFTAFLAMYRNLPSIDAILLNPDTAPVPTDVSTLYAVASALAHRADVNNFGKVLQFLDRMPQEYAVYSVRDAVGRNESLSTTHEFTQWAIKNQSVL
jgi:MoxR-like ATPase